MVTTTIRINVDTKKRLSRLRHKGQSYDGMLLELLDGQGVK